MLFGRFISPFLGASLCIAHSLRVHDSHFIPTHTLRVTAANISIDCHSRYSVVVNGSDPGPTLHLREGATHWIRVYNDIADQNVTIHWHGLTQRTAPFSDGTPQVSQWPIAPGHYFDYEVVTQLGDAGTYFYHSHVGYQSVSAHGALLVHDKGRPPYEYDGDITLLMGDYYNKSDNAIVSGLEADPFDGAGPVTSIVVNGQTGSAGFGDAAHRSCAPHLITVLPDKTYRMRFIGAGAKTIVTLGVEDHDNLTIIEADGTYSRPASTSHINVGPGQRFSALLKTKSRSELRQARKSSFWIRSGASFIDPGQVPLVLPMRVYDWMESVLQPLNDTLAESFPRLAEVTRTLRIKVSQTGIWNLTQAKFVTANQWALNNNSWTEYLPSSPYLVEIYKRGEAAMPDYDAALQNGGWDPATQIFPAKMGEVLDIVWENTNIPEPQYHTHPMHVHGKHIWDLGSGNGSYDAAVNERKFNGSYVPMPRDTTLLYRYTEGNAAVNNTAGWRAWRLRVEEAGMFLMHCHSLQHMIMGMQTVWSFGNASEITGEYPEPYVRGYLDFGGSAYGNSSYDPLVLHMGE